MQKKSELAFKKSPWFVVLLPVFYVIHGANENFGFIGISDISWLLLVYCGLSVVVYFILLFFFHNRVKAALLGLYLMSVYLFYGAIKDFLKTHLSFVSRYSVLLSLSVAVFFVLLLLFRKSKRSFSGTIFFFNLLFCIYLIADLGMIAIKFIHPAENRFSVYPLLKANDFPPIKNVPKPDIYFLVFDEYGSSLSLKENHGFINDIDSFLLARNFQIQTKAYSNYNYTPVSMASILNSSYINGIQNNTQLLIEEVTNCDNLIKNGSILKFLSDQGYNIINYSIFDLAGNPSPINQLLLPLKTRLIADNTAFSRIQKDLGGWMKINLHLPGNYLEVFENNLKLLQLTKDYSKIKNKQPDFVYAHFYMPHHPFYTDKYGRVKDMAILQAEIYGKYKSPQKYLEYLKYTNSEMKKLVDAIMHNTGGEAAMIIMGDHGFREKYDINLHQNFQTLNAVYLPGQDYHLFYDSISNVNQFRVVFNSLFKQSIPLLKDSVIFLTGNE